MVNLEAAVPEAEHDELTGARVRAWVDGFAVAVADHLECLAEADRRAGDGDYGDNIRAALTRAQALLPFPPETARDVLTAMSEGFLATGGTSGPLLGMWFRDLAGAAAERLTTNRLASGVAAGAATVQRLGGAEVGDKTMVDAMAPAAAALSQCAHTDPSTALSRAAAAARAGAESTRDLRARRGRATYVGAHAVGVVDPGALTVALFFEAGARTVRQDAR